MGGKWKPPLDIYELEDEIVIKLEIAGVKRKEISIIQEGNRIRISGTRKMERPGTDTHVSSDGDQLRRLREGHHRI